MKLYYSAGSCSTSCHITLEESGLKYQAIKVDYDNSADPNLTLVTKLNGLGTLPILITDDGKQLDQNLSIHTFVADKAVGKNLLPPASTFGRVEALNWLSFVAADLHKSVGSLFAVKMYSPDESVQNAVRTFLLTRANQTLSYLDSKLEGKDYLMGEMFTPADAYAYVVTDWTRWLDVPLTPYKNIQNYRARIASRPAVAKVWKDEGLE